MQDVFKSGQGKVFPAAVLEVYHQHAGHFRAACGWLDPETRQHPVQLNSVFDLASVSKLFLTTAFMTLVEENLVGLDQPVCSLLSDFNGLRQTAAYEDPLHPGEFIPTSFLNEVVDASLVTFRNLLAHNSGLPAWRPLFLAQDAKLARQMALNTPFFYPTGHRVVYSDIGLILLGLTVELVAGLPLDEAVYERVTRPLGLLNTHYLPVGKQSEEIENVAPTEFCKWRNRRIIAEVHDENAARFGGISGHAGLFSTAADLLRFGQMFLEGGGPILKPGTVAEMTRLQAEDGFTRRGLGFALWSPDPAASSNPFSPQVFGHTGFTGTSIWIDPQRQLVVALLTNRVYYGRDAAGITAYRNDIHRAILEGLDE